MTVSANASPSPAEFERLLVEFINSSVLGGKATVNRETRLFEDGYMNSLRILDLIAFVEKALGSRIPDRAVRLANFRTVATIGAAFHPGASPAATPVPAATVDRVFEHRRSRSRFASPVEALVNRGDLRLTSPGRVALSGFTLDVFTAVDRTVARWARELGATEHRYPSLIDMATLERAGRAHVMPSGASAVIPSEPNASAVIPSEPTESRGIDSVPVEGPLGQQSHDSSTPPPAAAALGMTTPPAVCYHAYPTWQGKTIGPNAILLTAVGHCHRDEDGNFAPLERLSHFTMREIIILGTREQVETHRQSLVRQVGELVTQLDLDATIEPASDPFFTSADEGRRLMQQLGALKLELQLTLDATGRTIAAASFNHHHDYFGTRFDVRLTDGSPAHSGCVAFGLERWVLALVTQHGVDENAWPAASRSWLRDARATEVGA